MIRAFALRTCSRIIAPGDVLIESMREIVWRSLLRFVGWEYCKDWTGWRTRWDQRIGMLVWMLI